MTLTELIFARGDAEGRITRPIKTEVNIESSFVPRYLGIFINFVN